MASVRAKFVVKKTDAVLRRMHAQAKLAAKHDLYVKAGVMGAEAKAEHDPGVTNLQVALAHEYGTPTVPQRSWIGASFRAHRPEYRVALGRAVALALSGKQSYEVGLGKIGAKMAADIKLFVRDRRVRPQLDPGGETYARRVAKGASDPTALLDTSRLVGSVTWQVAKGGA